jgi:serine/threonine protein phosphatase PrpC
LNKESSERRLFSGDADEADLNWSFGSASVRLQRSPNRENGSEDAIAVLPIGDNGVVLAVADGVGGSPGGREAALTALEMLRLGVGFVRNGELPPAIFASLETANQRLIEQRQGSGTTIVIAEIVDDKLRTYHVGDSEVLVVGQRGRIKHRVVPHSPTGFAVESGLISEDEAMHHEYRHILLNVVGAPNMRIEVSAPIELAAHDTVVLASDGLLDNLYMSEIVETARCGPLPEKADKLAAMAAERMSTQDEKLPSKPDDLSIVLYRRNYKKRSKN